MKQGSILIILLLILVGGYAQQEPWNENGFNNQPYFNPAFTGSAKGLLIEQQSRAQWVGFNGAPVELYFVTSFRRDSMKSSFGGYYVHDQLGSVNKNIVGVNYGYSVRMGVGELTFGLQLDNKFMQFDSIPSSNLIDPNDPAIIAFSGASFTLTSFGFGCVYMAPSFLLAASVKNIFTITNFDYYTQVPHYYFHGLYRYAISATTHLRSGLMIQSNGATVSTGFINRLHINNFIWGISYFPGSMHTLGIQLGYSIMNGQIQFVSGYSQALMFSGFVGITQPNISLMIKARI